MATPRAPTRRGGLPSRSILVRNTVPAGCPPLGAAPAAPRSRCKFGGASPHAGSPDSTFLAVLSRIKPFVALAELGSCSLGWLPGAELGRRGTTAMS
jgi:hypothetical protein